MTILLRRVVPVAVMLGLAAGGLRAQAHAVLGLGAGTVSPIKGGSSFRDDVKSPGFNVQGSVGIVPDNRTGSFRIDGQFGSLSYPRTTGGFTPRERSFAVNFDFMVTLIAAGAIRPYFLGGPSFAHFSYSADELGVGDSSTGGMGFNTGLGIQIGRSQRIGGFLEGRLIFTNKRKYVPITAGIRLLLRHRNEGKPEQGPGGG